MSQADKQDNTVAGHHSKEMLHYLLHRRSVPRKKLTEPGPTERELAQMLEAASRVPDHGKMVPFWFVVFQGQEKSDFEEVLADIMAQDKPKKDEDKLQATAEKLMSSPLVIAVISSVRESKKIPAWEQFLSVGAACQNLVLAANALGYGINWLTEWYSYDDRVKKALHLNDKENIAGFFFIGTAEDVPSDRDRPETEKIVTYWHQDNPVIHRGEEYAIKKDKPGKGNLGFELPESFFE